MKAITFENIYNREKFVCRGKKDIQVIDGVEYIKVFKYGTQRQVLVRKDFLKKVNG